MLHLLLHRPVKLLAGVRWRGDVEIVIKRRIRGGIKCNRLPVGGTGKIGRSLNQIIPSRALQRHVQAVRRQSRS